MTSPSRRIDGNRRRLLFAGAGAGMMALMPGMHIRAADRPARLPKLVVQLDWLISNGQIGEIVALNKGYFRDAGLDVELAPGGPNATTVASVLSGAAGAGQMSAVSQLLLARSSGIPITMFATGYQRSPFAYFSLPKTPIRTPRDLVGKRLGVQPTARTSVDALFRKTGIDPSSVSVSTIGFDMTPLLAGRVDAVTGWVTNTAALAVLGPNRITMEESVAGIIDPGNAYFASEDALDHRSDVLVGFLGAAARGWWSFRRDPAAAIQAAVAAFPSLDGKVELATAPVVLGFAFDARTDAQGWGTFAPREIDQQIALLDQIGTFEGAIRPSAASCCTTEILGRTSGLRLGRT